MVPPLANRGYATDRRLSWPRSIHGNFCATTYNKTHQYVKHTVVRLLQWHLHGHLAETAQRQCLHQPSGKQEHSATIFNITSYRVKYIALHCLPEQRIQDCHTSFGHCSSMASLSVWPHCANARRIRCQADLNSLPLGELEETLLYYVDEDYPAGPGIIEPLPERSNWRGSESSTLEIDVYIWRYAFLVVDAKNDDDDDDDDTYVQGTELKTRLFDWGYGA